MNRRRFLTLMGVSAGTALVSAELIGTLAAGLPKPLNAPVMPDQRDPVSHILNRLGFGPRPGLQDTVQKMGVQAYIDQQLDPASIDDSAMDKRLEPFATLTMSAADLGIMGKTSQDMILLLDAATLLRAVYSERQLFEVMVNFWSEHFSIWQPKDDCKFLKTVDDREVARKYALGKFRDILGASAKSPAMLVYLDNAGSLKEHPNENYAREVMELHTITLGNFTEQDVKEVARCFTGWTIQDEHGDHPYEFIFDPTMHDDGEKTVLGRTIPAGGGIQDGETVLDMLASHPGTALHIASKLCRRFIADDPPDTVVKAVAQVFTQSSGDILKMLQTIYASDEFLNAPPKFKRPFEYVVSLFRAFDVEIVTPQAGIGNLIALAMLSDMGHLPFDHITPDGYTDYAALWIDTMLPRWNAAILTVIGTLPGVKIDIDHLISGQNVEAAPRPMLDYFAQHLLGRALAQSELDTVWSFANAKGALDLTSDPGRKRLNDAIALLAASPFFQYR